MLRLLAVVLLILWVWLFEKGVGGNYAHILFVAALAVLMYRRVRQVNESLSIREP